MPGARGSPYALAPVNPSLAGVLMNLLARLHSLVVGLGAAAALATFATAANAQTKWDLPAA